MPELIAVRVYLSTLAAHIWKMGDEEQGEMSLEPVILGTVVAALAVTVVVLGTLKLIRLFAGS